MKKVLNTWAAIGLSLFFIAIVLVLMIGVLEVQDADNGTAAFVFAGIEFFILLMVFGLGQSFSRSIGVEMYTVLCTTTVVYVILGTIVNCAVPDSLSTVAFTLIDLVLLFVYFIVSVPLCVTGANSAGDRQPVDPMNPHNLPDPYSMGRVNNLPNTPPVGYGAPDPRTAAPASYTPDPRAAAPAPAPIGFSTAPAPQPQQFDQTRYAGPMDYAPSQQPRNR